MGRVVQVWTFDAQNGSPAVEESGRGGGTRVLMGSGMGLAPTQRISAKNSESVGTPV